MKQWWRNVRPYVLAVPIYCLARLINMTIRMREVGWEKVEAVKGGRIIAGWHGITFLATNHFRNRGYWAIISLSKDGDMQDSIFRRFGYRTIRGSTGRGGLKAAIESIRVLKNGDTMALTPDGPRGPSGIVQEGIMLMARKSGAALIPVGISARRRWNAPTWDRYMVPMPFTRGIMVFAEPIFVPSDASEDEVEAIRLKVQEEIHRVQAEADQLA